MAVRKLLYRDLVRGVAVYAHYDVLDGLIGIEEEYQEDQTLEYVKVLKDAPIGKDTRHFMEVPHSLKARAIAEGWDNDKEKWRRIMNDPDYKYLRVWEGRV